MFSKETAKMPSLLTGNSPIQSNLVNDLVSKKETPTIQPAQPVKQTQPAQKTAIKPVKTTVNTPNVKVEQDKSKTILSGADMLINATSVDANNKLTESKTTSQNLQNAILKENLDSVTLDNLKKKQEMQMQVLQNALSEVNKNTLLDNTEAFAQTAIGRLANYLSIDQRLANQLSQQVSTINPYTGAINPSQMGNLATIAAYSPETYNAMMNMYKPTMEGIQSERDLEQKMAITTAQNATTEQQQIEAEQRRNKADLELYAKKYNATYFDDLVKEGKYTASSIGDARSAFDKAKSLGLDNEDAKAVANNKLVRYVEPKTTSDLSSMLAQERYLNDLRIKYNTKITEVSNKLPIIKQIRQQVQNSKGAMNILSNPNINTFDANLMRFNLLRASGSVGAISDRDFAISAPAQSVIMKINSSLQKGAFGKLSKEEAKLLNEAVLTRFKTAKQQLYNEINANKSVDWGAYGKDKDQAISDIKTAVGLIPAPEGYNEKSGLITKDKQGNKHYYYWDDVLGEFKEEKK